MKNSKIFSLCAFCIAIMVSVTGNAAQKTVTLLGDDSAKLIMILQSGSGKIPVINGTITITGLRCQAAFDLSPAGCLAKGPASDGGTFRTQITGAPGKQLSDLVNNLKAKLFPGYSSVEVDVNSVVCNKSGECIIDIRTVGGAAG